MREIKGEFLCQQCGTPLFQKRQDAVRDYYICSKCGTKIPVSTSLSPVCNFCFSNKILLVNGDYVCSNPDCSSYISTIQYVEELSTVDYMVALYSCLLKTYGKNGMIALFVQSSGKEFIGNVGQRGDFLDSIILKAFSDCTRKSKEFAKYLDRFFGKTHE